MAGAREKLQSENEKARDYKVNPLDHIMGRPPKYDPSWMLQRVIDLMKVGATKVELCAEFGVCRDTIYDWIEKHKEFKAAVKIGSILQQAWWEREGRMNLSNNKFNSPLWSKMVSNMFREDWSEKREQGHVDIASIMSSLKLDRLSNDDISTLSSILRLCVDEKKTVD